MAPFHIAEVAQSKEKLPSQVGRDRIGRSLRFEIAKADDLRLLRARSERPCSRCAAEKRDELASLHSITSSALVLACLRKSYARLPTTLLAITASTIVKPNSARCTGSST